jgi:tRNA(adenine34) deaminase
MTDSVHERFMERALEEAARAADLGEVPVGAVVVRGDAIVAIGYNRREIDQDPAGHAELIAMREAAKALGSWRLDGCTVYVTLEPCPMCAGLMVLARVDRCVFGCPDPKGGFLGTLADLSSFPGLNHHFDVVRGVRGEASADMLRSFFRALRAR